MALILNKAFDDAKMKGYKYWNWGGTWLSQKGVFRFKKKNGELKVQIIITSQKFLMKKFLILKKKSL